MLRNRNPRYWKSISFSPDCSRLPYEIPNTSNSNEVTNNALTSTNNRASSFKPPAEAIVGRVLTPKADSTSPRAQEVCRGVFNDSARPSSIITWSTTKFSNPNKNPRSQPTDGRSLTSTSAQTKYPYARARASRLGCRSSGIRRGPRACRARGRCEV